VGIAGESPGLSGHRSLPSDGVVANPARRKPVRGIDATPPARGAKRV